MNGLGARHLRVRSITEAVMRRRGFLFERGIVRLEQGIMLGMSFVITLAMFSAVLIRYVFHTPLFGTEEIALLAAYWLYFTGASLTTYEESHIKAEVFKLFFKSESSLRIIKLVELFVSIFICSVFIYYTLKYLQWTLGATMLTAYLNIPYALHRASLFMGFVLIVFHLIMQVWRYSSGEWRKPGATLKSDLAKGDA